VTEEAAEHSDAQTDEEESEFVPTDNSDHSEEESSNDSDDDDDDMENLLFELSDMSNFWLSVDFTGNWRTADCTFVALKLPVYFAGFLSD